MDQNQKLLDHAAKIDKYDHFLRRTLQVVISVSLLSLFFFYYPGVFFFPYSLVHTLERKYIFIICNGILAFLAKSSSSRSLYSYSDETVLGGKFSGAVPKLDAIDVVSEEQTLSPESSITSPVGVSFVDEEGKEQETVEDQEADHEEQEEQDNSEDLENENDSDEEDNGRFSSKEEEAEEVEEATESAADEELTISTDELNKKFEEFIRKMKEELRIQAQQQLITA
ncbi:hypothetical protein L484_010593 [Morus notabilis]|uniref:DUF4408 domain-containing protein n=1 Tax=Morus notabilis TaxID=981085 RepID=W9QDS8_9ROSA|nr:rRNA biogenesis protein RRP36 [Morus notabilis]EXB29535.1 hypothetical protein L484_010593 [Morus notabilis]